MASTAKDHERYKSGVVHLPQHIVEPSEVIKDDQYLALTGGGSNTPHANVKSIVVVDELAEFLTLEEAPHPTMECIQKISPKAQTTLLWSMIALFFISILISTLLFAQKSIIILYIIQILCALCGLVLSYVYNTNLHFTYSLSNKIDDLLSEQKELKEKLESKENDDNEPHDNIALLESFRGGFMHKELSFCSRNDIAQLLPVIAHTLCELPFGLTQFRSSLFVILAERISTDPYLDQSWRFFLNSYGDVPSISRIWENHEYLQHDDGDDDDYKSAIDSVKWFRSLYKDLDTFGSMKSVAANRYLCDPINGNSLVKVILRETKPYLIDCYTLNDKLSSTFLLKRGVDLRQTLSVILMFKYFNALWNENGNIYNTEQCKAITFEVVPISTDFGIIQYIENTQKISDINGMSNEKMINRLIATAAGGYIASYILGINITNNNILIGDDGALIHIKFDNIFDEENVFILDDFMKLIGNDKWNEFLDIAVQCFSVLRKNYIQILDYSRIVFDFMQKKNENEKYLKESLLLNIKEEEDALNTIKMILSKVQTI